MPKFSVIIVAYGLEAPANRALLQAAVRSLAGQSERDFEVLLVDNSETAGGLEALDLAGLPAVTVLPYGGNHGFAKGNNLAAAEARGEWVVLLNPDAVAERDWLAEIGAGIDRHPAAAMFASLQVSLDDPERLDGVGDAYFGLGFAWRGGFGRPVSEVPGEGACFSPCGAGAVYRRDAFQAAGGFDEAFFCFGEDTDLAYRLRLRGAYCVFLPGACIRHAGGGVSGRASAFSVTHGARNRIWGFVKATPPMLFWLTLPGHVGFTLLVLARGVMTGRFVPTLAGIWKGLAGVGPMIAQRRTLQAARTATSGDLAAAMAWNPLRLLQRKGDVRRLQ
ncbi:MAG: glycosyltransferase family 2 protein [Pseudomonadota bacterium]